MSILGYLREQRVVHRDIKPANLVLNEKFQLILADFGTSKVIDSSYLSPLPLALRKCHSVQNLNAPVGRLEDEEVEMVGTEEYISPEAISGKQSGVSFGSDLWSLGVILWQIFSNRN